MALNIEDLTHHHTQNISESALGMPDFVKALSAA